MEYDVHLILEAASIEDALSQASQQWEVLTEDLSAEIVNEEKFFFGLLGKRLKVLIKPQKPLLLLRSKNFLINLFSLMGLEMVPSFQLQELKETQELQDNKHMISIDGSDADIIVGRYGDGLKSMEYLLNLALRNCNLGKEPRVRLDSGGYRERRKRSLERLAEASARKVTERGAPLRLEPMLSWERWVIHTTLKDHKDVETQSIGEPPDRKVIIIPRLNESRRTGSGGVRARYRRK